MPLKKPQDLSEGMILSDDVLNLDGQILFAKGVELSNRQIEILQSWGIPNVDVEGDEDDTDPIDLDQFSPHILSQAEKIVGAHFALVKSSHPAVEMVHKVCVMQTAMKLKAKEE